LGNQPDAIRLHFHNFYSSGDIGVEVLFLPALNPICLILPIGSYLWPFAVFFQLTATMAQPGTRSISVPRDTDPLNRWGEPD